MTQSVMTQTANLFGSTPSVTSKGKQAGKGFDLFIGNNMKTGQNTAGNVDSTTVKKTSFQKTGAAQTNKSDDADLTDNQTDNVQTKAASTDNTTAANQTGNAKANTVKDTGSTEDKEASTGDVTVNEQLISEIVGMLQSVQQAVMNTLNLSQEELNQLLQDQGMTITDLLNPDNLQQLVLANSGQTNILSALTDENLANQMKELLQKVDGIITNADLGLTKEQIDAILTKAGEQTPTDPQTAISQTTETSDAAAATATQEEKQPEAVNKKSEDAASSDDTNSVKGSKTELVQTDNTKESNTGAHQDTGKHDNKNLKAPDQFQAFVDNLVGATKETQVSFSGNMVQVTQLREIANQIIESIKVTVNTDQTSMELQLNPENLGKVNLTVQSKNGVMTAQFVVQNEVSKEAIESQMNTLKETLSAQGLKVDAIEVTVANYAFDQNSQDAAKEQDNSKQNNNGKKITLEEAIQMTDDAVEDATTQDVTGIRGSQIDYTA